MRLPSGNPPGTRAELSVYLHKTGAFTGAFHGTDQYIIQYDNELGPPWKSEGVRDLPEDLRSVLSVS